MCALLRRRRVENHLLASSLVCQTPPAQEDVRHAPHQTFDHIGITVTDLDAVTAFFVELGLEVDGRMFVEGEFVDTVTGVPDARTEIVGLRAPGGGTWIELSSFVRPDHQPGSPTAMANELGLRNVSFEFEFDELSFDHRPASR